MAEIEVLLRVLGAIDLKKGVSDTVAEYLNRGIFSALRELQKSKGLPENDPLRFDKDGARLSKKELHQRLDGIIESMPTDKGKWDARKTDYQSRL